MRDRCLPDNVKSRQSCLKVFIKDRKPVVDSQSARATSSAKYFTRDRSTR